MLKKFVDNDRSTPAPIIGNDLKRLKKQDWKLAVWNPLETRETTCPILSIRDMIVNVATDNLTVKPYIPHKSIFQWICCKYLAW